MIVGGRMIEVFASIIDPFRRTYEDHGLSGGLGPAGYDVSVEFDGHGEVRTVMLKPGEFLLASTVEHFKMPDNILGVVHDKSTLARRGLAVQNTVIEPGWSGYLTLELTNHSNETMWLSRGQPIAQVIFHYVRNGFPYSGKYPDQKRGPQVPK